MDIRGLPMLLTRSRLVLGPLALGLALLRVSGGVLAALMVVALLTDIFDGVIARRLNIVTPDLRVADSRADGVFTFSTVAAILLTHFAEIRPYWAWIALLAGLEAATTIVDYARYGRPCSHHAYSAKLWALSYCAFAVAALAFGRVQPYLSVCIACGVINNLEGYVIRGLLPVWTHDVSGIPAAIRLRRVQMAGRSEH